MEWTEEARIVWENDGHPVTRSRFSYQSGRPSITRNFDLGPELARVPHYRPANAVVIYVCGNL